MLKQCRECHQDKPTTEFYYSSFTKDNLMYICKTCHTNWYLKNKLEIEKSIKEYEIKKLKQRKEREEIEGEPIDLVTRFARNKTRFNGGKLIIY